MTTHHRRWFAFSLRTLFVVVTVFCVWLGWQVKIVADRKALLALLKERHVNVSDTLRPPANFIRAWLGDIEPAGFVVQMGQEEEVREIQRLFPGISIMRS